MKKSDQNVGELSIKLRLAITIQEHKDVSARFVEFDIQLIQKKIAYPEEIKQASIEAKKMLLRKRKTVILSEQSLREKLFGLQEEVRKKRVKQNHRKRTENKKVIPI